MLQWVPAASGTYQPDQLKYWIYHKPRSAVTQHKLVMFSYCGLDKVDKVPTAIDGQPGNAITTTVEGLLEGEIYYFNIIVEDPMGESSWSES